MWTQKKISLRGGLNFLQGYWSKNLDKQWSLNTIVIFPHCQSNGYGQLMIAFSYLLLKVEGVAGAPERPRSGKGRHPKKMNAYPNLLKERRRVLTTTEICGWRNFGHLTTWQPCLCLGDSQVRMRGRVYSTSWMNTCQHLLQQIFLFSRQEADAIHGLAMAGLQSVKEPQVCNPFHSSTVLQLAIYPQMFPIVPFNFFKSPFLGYITLFAISRPTFSSSFLLLEPSLQRRPRCTLWNSGSVMHQLRDAGGRSGKKLWLSWEEFSLKRTPAIPAGSRSSIRKASLNFSLKFQSMERRTPGQQSSPAPAWRTEKEKASLTSLTISWWRTRRRRPRRTWDIT